MDELLSKLEKKANESSKSIKQDISNVYSNELSNNINNEKEIKSSKNDIDTILNILDEISLQAPQNIQQENRSSIIDEIKNTILAGKLLF